MRERVGLAGTPGLGRTGRFTGGGAARWTAGLVLCALWTTGSVGWAAGEAPPAAWSDVLEQATPAVVSIRMDSVRTFDTATAGNSVATGFVIDAEQGLILTNRHVVTPGPVRSEAVFLNNEEVSLQPVYFDPVHDFGVYRFDPTDVRFMALAELDLDPAGAKVGTEVRIIGNDAGEKISILSGTLARLDRGAPLYGVGRYNDFNTFYIQSASSTSGGSSGSPVINQNGRVVALNAGANRSSAASFFLPLDRVVRAVDLIRQGKPVSRGTLQTTFEHLPYDELQRLGLTPAEEARLRKTFANGTGLLVVEQVQPGGPADGLLRPGDILLSVNGAPLDGFVPLEAALDDSVGQPVQLQVVRGGESLELAPTVGDLHAITPDHYLEVGGGVVHDLSYQMSRTQGLAAGGVYVAFKGYSFGGAGIPSGAVITEVAGRPVDTVDAFAELLTTIPDGARVPVRWHSVGDPNRVVLSVLVVDRLWFSTQMCRRNLADGSWPCEDLPTPGTRVTPTPTEVALPSAPNRLARKVAPSLVTVDFDIPFRVSGVHGVDFRGTGLVVDAERGLVVVDRDTVPISLGDVRVVVGGSVQLPARVVWVHPARNLAFVQYDPALLPGAPLKSAVLAEKPAEEGSKVAHIGLDRDHSVVSQATHIEEVAPLYLPLPRTPFFRATNTKVLKPATAAGSTGGVLVDRKGRVQALWASYVDLSGKEPAGFFRGMPVEVISEALEAYRANPTAPWPVLGAELATIELTRARDLGLSAERSAQYEAAQGSRRVLVVARTVRTAPARDVLLPGDLILEANGSFVREPWEVEDLISDGAVQLTVLRDGKELGVRVEPHLLATTETDRVLIWAGAVLQDVPPWLPAQRGTPETGVYVSWYWYGTPAGRYGLRPSWRIVAVNDTQVDNLEAFVAALGDPAASVRLTYVDLKGREKVLTLKPNPEAWPTEDLRRDVTTGTWTRQRLSP